MDSEIPPPEPAPSAFNYILSFILVGVAWGFTTPFIRRAAVDFNKRQEESRRSPVDIDAASAQEQQQLGNGGRGFALKQKIKTLFWTVVNLLRTPAYAIPLVVNLTGSVWFFLLVGKHGTFTSLFLSARQRSWKSQTEPNIYE
jgi:Putative transmembrane family 234